MRTHIPEYARSEYHTQLANISLDKIFDLTTGVYFHFYDVYIPGESYYGSPPNFSLSKSQALKPAPGGIS